MPIKLNRTSSDIERTYWNNSVPTYFGFYADQWVTRTGTDQAWQEVVWGNGVFMAVSSDGATNRAMSSLDGINWYIRNTGTTTSHTFQTVTWSSDLGMFVALSSAGTSRIISTRPLGKSHLLESIYYT